MRINLHATYRLAAGAKSVEVEWKAGMTLNEALEALVAGHPSLRLALFDADGRRRDQVHVFINRQDATHAPDGPGRVLEAEDVIDLFPPVSGGVDRGLTA